MIWFLLALYQLKHWVADFPLQNEYMLGKFKGGKEWIAPLSAHCAVHALFTLFITLSINAHLWWLSVVDFAVHFTMDRIKASPFMLGRYKSLSSKEYLELLMEHMRDNTNFYRKYQIEKQFADNKYFWWALGLDQMVHHLTHYFIIYILVT